MKKNLLGICLLAVFTIFSCTNREQAEVEGDYNEFKTWANQQEARAEQSTEAEWAEIEREYNEKTAKLDQKTDRMSAEARQEYEETKTNFQNWSNRNREYVARQQTQSGGMDAAAGNMPSAKWSSELLGKYSDLSTITAANAKDVYIAFMENVRAKHDKWTDADWDEADKVFDQLDKRTDMIEGISLKDKTKIGALETEYRALETGDEAKSTMKSIKD